MKILSIILLIISVTLSLKHFWDGLHIEQSPQSLKMMTDLGISKAYIPLLNYGSLAVAILVLFPQTYFVGNLLNAFTIVLIMAMALRAGITNIALMEIPFLVLPLAMIYLKYPFKI